MSVSNKTNYNENKKYWKQTKKKKPSVATRIQCCLPQFFNAILFKKLT